MLSSTSSFHPESSDTCRMRPVGIRGLNLYTSRGQSRCANHRNPSTVEEMQEELETLDHDRYFNGDSLHVFDEINQILEWQPAEWDAE